MAPDAGREPRPGPRPAARGLLRLILLAGLAAPAAAFAEPPRGLLPPPEGADARAIAQRADDVMRSDTTEVQGSMTVVSPRLPAPRVVRFHSFEERPTRRSLIRILAPPKDAGTGFLLIYPNLWMYVPRVERTIRIPPSLMLQSWMGSDFTNDDLVHSSSLLEDYTHRLLGVDPAPEGHPGKRAWVLEYRPREEAPVVWGRIVAWIEMERATPLREDFYDEEGVRVRTLRFDRVEEVQGRAVPHRWVMRPLEKPGHETRIELEKIRFDVPIDPEIFTLRNLQRWR